MGVMLATCDIPILLAWAEWQLYVVLPTRKTNTLTFILPGTASLLKNVFGTLSLPALL